MPSPGRNHRKPRAEAVRVTVVLCAAMLGAIFFAAPVNAQIASVTNTDGRRLFVNAEPPALFKRLTPKAPATIYLGGEICFRGGERPPMNIDRDGAEKLVREAAERHHIDPALVRAVIE